MLTIHPIYSDYRAALLDTAAQQPEEWTFKSDQRYTGVVDNVSYEQGEVLLDWAIEMFGVAWFGIFIQTAKISDQYGTPVKASFARLGISCSPANLRYLTQALKVWRHIDSLKQEEINVVELGGGYGGLALYVRALAPLFETTLLKYAIVDIPEAVALQRAYRRTLDADHHSFNGLTETGTILARKWLEGSKFFVSAYAFSEFHQPMRDWYAEKLIKYCDHGLIVWNFPEVFPERPPMGGPPYPFTDKPLHVEPDLPDLYPGHLLVTW